jgi:hypothetical protein
MNTTGQAKYIAYYRVSTARQGRSGLGLAAQQKAVSDYLKGEKPLHEFTEVESGAFKDRPRLSEALAACRIHRAILIIAKLDRLARNVAFVSNLMEAGVEFEAVDLAPRLVAAWEGNRKIEARRRKRHQLNLISDAPTFLRIWKIAEHLRNLHAKSIAIRRTKPKQKGGYRELYEFNAFGIAKQKLFVNAIQPFASFHPSQFALRRGRPAACESLLNAMNRPLIRNVRFVQVDVRDFFPSISREWIEENVRAPKAMIRTTLFLDGWTIVNRGNNAMVDRRRVPQGSAAASFVAEMVMADVLRCAAGQLADMLWLHTYSDNVGGFLPLNIDAAAFVERLRHAFATHRAGPFHITSSEAARLSQAFRFLGYWFVKPAGKKARAFLPSDIWQLKEMEFVIEFSDAETPQQMLDVCNRLRSYCSAFKLAIETRLLMRRVVKFMSAELKYRDSGCRN